MLSVIALHIYGTALTNGFIKPFVILCEEVGKNGKTPVHNRGQLQRNFFLMGLENILNELILCSRISFNMKRRRLIV
jgi:hypothetical protein